MRRRASTSSSANSSPTHAFGDPLDTQVVDDCSEVEGECERETASRLRVVVLGLELGAGRDERASVLQAAVGLARRGHEVLFCTSCLGDEQGLPEVEDGTLRVRVLGARLPLRVLGRFSAACSALRVAWVCAWLVATERRFDCVVHDQASVSNPLLFSLAPRLLLYCHFPDLLLCARRGGVVRRFFRAPLRWGATLAAGLSSRILLHSEFARKTLRGNFASLRHVDAQVLPPPVDASPPLLRGSIKDRTQWCAEQAFEQYVAQVAFKALVDESAPYFLALGRYERGQNLVMAIDAFRNLVDENGGGHAVLVIAGNYDPRNAEHHWYHEELRFHAECSGVEGRTVFLRSISGALKYRLTGSAVAVIYTAEYEHCGTAPCEAMALSVPVVACAAGGPQEAVVDGVTGIVVPDHEEYEDKACALGAALGKILVLHTHDRGRWAAMGQAGQERVERLFSPDRFAERLEELLVPDIG